MGQEEEMWQRLPDVLAVLEQISGELDDLGCDGIAMLRESPRLSSALDYMQDWKNEQLQPHRNLKQPVYFELVGSAFLDQLKVITKVMRRLARSQRALQLSL